ncbi:MAG: helix-turn-helix domain-containing protein [Myxococcales bacterium]|jgi:AcrR family transcriptional regulator
MEQVREVRVPVQARARRTRAALVSAAEAELSERGYAAATARSIAQRAGVATGSFYQYFPDKDAALHEIARARTDELAGRVREAIASTSDPRQAVRRVVAEVVRYHRADRALHAVLEQRRHADPELDRITRASEARFVGEVEQLLGAGPGAGDARARAFVIFGLVEGAVHAHVLGGAMVSDRRFEGALVDAVLQLAER